MNGSVRVSVSLSVCPSVTPFWLCSHHRIIVKFSGVITNDKSDVYAKGQGQRSKIKVTEVNTQLSRFRTVPPVWIHIWWWNDAQSFILLRRGALLFNGFEMMHKAWCSIRRGVPLFFDVIHRISRTHGLKNRWFRSNLSTITRPVAAIKSLRFALFFIFAYD